MTGEQADRAEKLRREIADIERLMVDMPPHHAGGTRRATEERLDDLRRALHRIERPSPSQRPTDGTS